MRWIVSTVFLSLFALPAWGAERPNVVFLFSDDQRLDTIAALGNEYIQTPNLDRLVRQGTTFTNAYCMGSLQGAVCLPSRAMVMSGRTLFRAPGDLEGVAILPEVLQSAGYATFGAGKWHNRSPSFARGFTHGGPVFFGGMSDHDQVPVFDFDPQGKYPPADKKIGEGFSSELFADGAVEFLRQQKDKEQDKPFFLYVAFTAPHDPRTPPGKYAILYDPQKLPLPANYLPVHPFHNGEMTNRDESLAPWPRTPKIVRQHLADYYGMISHMDAQVGRVLEALEDSGHAENTILVFASDHGLAVGSHGLLGKQNLYEHSMGAPLVIAGPGLPRDQRSDAFCYLLDIFPTICELAGVTKPESVEGQSLAPVLKGEKKQLRDSIYGAYRDVQRSVRTRDWKLIRYPRINKTQLFHLAEDPHELNNLADDPNQAVRVEQMLAQLIAWQTRLDDEQPLSSDDPAPEQFIPPKQSD